jgi:hypothetical protein
MDWIAVLYICSAVNLKCDEHNSYSHLQFSDAYITREACWNDFEHRLLKMPEVEAGLRVTMTCEQRE